MQKSIFDGLKRDYPFATKRSPPQKVFQYFTTETLIKISNNASKNSKIICCISNRKIDQASPSSREISIQIVSTAIIVFLFQPRNSSSRSFVVLIHKLIIFLLIRRKKRKENFLLELPRKHTRNKKKNSIFHLKNIHHVRLIIALSLSSYYTFFPL